mgnify:CR=1 FL=1
MKTSELKDAALDWAVSTITNPEWSDEDRRWNIYDYVDTGDEGDEPYSPSTIWAQGGPIIERECISVVPLHGAMWGATTFPIHQIFKDDSEAYYQGVGPTPLIAAMRCFCVSKLGDEVELPKELK